MEAGLENKSAIVTGGAYGIGRAACLALGGRGANVAVIDVDYPQAQKVVSEIAKFGGKAIAVEANVAEELEVESAVEQIIDAYGKIDILVNNAAIEILTPMVSVKVEDWDRVINTNLRGTFLFTRAVIPHMIDKHGGTIVNLGSVDGMRGRANGAAYAASKAAIICFTEALADELAKYQIRANVICPAGVNTTMWRKTHPQSDPNSVLQPEEVADMIVFFASQQSQAINGATIEVLGPRLVQGTYL